MLQTFCIPGTIAINVVCGTLYGVAVALPLCVISGTLGACSCYMLSRLVGRPLAVTVDNVLMKGNGIALFQAKVDENKQNLFGFLTFLRVSPLLPNWLINLASPVIGIPFRLFSVATAIGITPQTFIAVRVGAFLVDVKNVPQGGRIIGMSEWFTLAGLAMLILLPTVLKEYARRKK